MDLAEPDIPKKPRSHATGSVIPKLGSWGNDAPVVLAKKGIGHMNHFNDVVQNLQQTPQPQRPDVLIESIAKQMQQSGNQQTQQLGEELEQAKTLIVKAFNQRQQGG